MLVGSAADAVVIIFLALPVASALVVTFVLGSLVASRLLRERRVPESPPQAKPANNGAPRPQLVRRSDGTVDDIWPEYWGMTIAQCRQFLRECQQAPGWNPGSSLYTLVSEFVVPRTSGTGMGLALLMNVAEPLEVNVMVSHAWTENAEEFVHALELSTSSDDVLFICAFSLYQCLDGCGPSIAEQLGTAASESPFHRVLRHIADVGRRDGLLWRWHPSLGNLPAFCCMAAVSLIFLPAMVSGCMPDIQRHSGNWHVYCRQSAWDGGRLRLGAFAGRWETGAFIDDSSELGFGDDKFARYLLCAAGFVVCASCALILLVCIRLARTYRGRMLVVPNRECDIYSRLWCVYEIFVARALGVPVVLARTLARAGSGSSTEAECSSREDKCRIRGEIEGFGVERSGKAESGYELVDDAIAATTASTRHRLLLPMILQSWPIMHVEISILRLCVGVPEGYEVIWALEAVVCFLVGFGATSILYRSVRRHEGLLPSACLRGVVFWLCSLGVLVLLAVAIAAASGLSNGAMAFVWPLVLTGATFLIFGIAVAPGLLRLRLRTRLCLPRHILARWATRANWLGHCTLLGLNAIAVVTWRHTAVWNLYAILVFSFIGGPCLLASFAVTWDLRML